MTDSTTPWALVCDDEEDSFQKVKGFLAEKKYGCDERVDTLEELRGALDRAHRGRHYHRLVLIDLDLSKSRKPSVLTGEQVYQTIRQDFPHEFYVLYTRQFTESTRGLVNRLSYEKVAFVLLDDLASGQYLSTYLSPIIDRTDSREVFVVEGRNERKNEKLRSFLRDMLGLQPRQWDFAVSRAGHASPSNSEIVMKGIELTHATIVLFTDDEEVSLVTALRHPRDAEQHGRGRRQSRANVYIEAGYALGVRPRRTVFVEWPRREAGFKSPTDFAGIHVVQFKDTPAGREALKDRLEDVRCSLALSPDWKNAPLAFAPRTRRSPAE